VCKPSLVFPASSSRNGGAIRIPGDAFSSRERVSALDVSTPENPRERSTSPVEAFEESLSERVHKGTGIAVHRHLQSGRTRVQDGTRRESRENDAGHHDVLSKLAGFETKLPQCFHFDQEHLSSLAARVVIAGDPRVRTHPELILRYHGLAASRFDEEMLDDALHWVLSDCVVVNRAVSCRAVQEEVS